MYGARGVEGSGFRFVVKRAVIPRQLITAKCNKFFFFFANGILRRCVVFSSDRVGLGVKKTDDTATTENLPARER